MNAVTRRFLGPLTMVAFFVLITAIHFGCGDRDTVLMIEKPTEIRSITQASVSPEPSSPSLQPGHVIATLKAGETARAVGVYHGKDFDASQVRLADGTEGLIMAGDTFKVVSR